MGYDVGYFGGPGGPTAVLKWLQNSKAPYTAHLKTLVPNTIPGIASGTRVFEWTVLKGGGGLGSSCK